jgi:TatA/E family protein of Tat protein translocase
MGSISPAHLLIAAFVVVLLFGAGRISRLCKDAGQGIRAFRDALKGDGD